MQTLYNIICADYETKLYSGQFQPVKLIEDICPLWGNSS